MTTIQITPTPKGCHPGCRTFGDSGVTLELDTDHNRWYITIPDEPTQVFSYRFEAYTPALLAAYRVTVLDSLHTY